MEVNDRPASLGMAYGQHVVSSTIVDFIDRNNRNKPLCTEVLYDDKVSTDVVH